MAWITIRHPKTGGVAEVPEKSLPVYERRGWKRVDTSASTALASSEDSPESDPSPRAEARRANHLSKKEQSDG